MRNTYLILLVIIFTGCLPNKDKRLSAQLINELQTETDSLINILPDIIEPVLGSDWIKEYSWYLMQKFPNFSIDYSKQSYIVVPSFVIPSKILVKDSINLINYLEEGKMEIIYSQVFILEAGKTVGSFTIEENRSIIRNRGKYYMAPLTFHETFRNSKVVEIFNNHQLFFEFVIEHKNSKYNIPDIVFFDGNNFKLFLSDDNKIYPVSELYRAWLYPDKEKFRQFLNGLIEANQKSKK